VRSLRLYAVDLAIVLGATLAALVIRADFAVPHDRWVAFLPYLGLSLASALVFIGAFRLHRNIWGLTAERELERVVRAGALIVLGACVLGFAWNRLEGVPRSLPIIQVVLIIGAMLAARLLARRWRQRRQGRGAAAEAVRATLGPARSSVLIVGINAIADLYLKGCSELVDQEIDVAGILGRSEHQIGRLVRSHRVLGMPEDVQRVLRDLEIEGITVNCIAVAVPFHKLSLKAREALTDIERTTNVRLHLLADRLGLGEGPEALVRAAGTPAPDSLPFSPRERALIAGRSYFAWKRALDVVGAAVLMALAAPLILLVGIAVLIDVGAPVMFCQRRPGLMGRPFRIYKFRSMRAAYDRQGRRVDDEQRSSWLGRFLRRTRLDELPQLYNVLIGNMSFVGPRPLLPIDQAPEYRARLLVRPGLTGWAQIKGGRVIGPADKAALDVWYVQNASLWLDVRIALATIPMVVLGERLDRKAIASAWRDLEPTGIVAGWSTHGDSMTTAIHASPVPAIAAAEAVAKEPRTKVA
jgi:lipopolysaccharide/colanic/teichoic acid biosynthesis glycosyltransferase